MEFHYLPMEQVQHYWPNIVSGMQQSPGSFKGMPPQALYSALSDGRFSLWEAGTPTSVLVFVLTEVVISEGERWLAVRWCLGKHVDELLEIADQAFDMVCRTLNCKGVLIETPRKGWTRVLRNIGFEEVAVVLRRYARMERPQ